MWNALHHKPFQIGYVPSVCFHNFCDIMMYKVWNSASPLVTSCYIRMMRPSVPIYIQFVYHLMDVNLCSSYGWPNMFHPGYQIISVLWISKCVSSWISNCVSSWMSYFHLMSMKSSSSYGYEIMFLLWIWKHLSPMDVWQIFIGCLSICGSTHQLWVGNPMGEPNVGQRPATSRVILNKFCVVSPS